MLFPLSKGEADCRSRRGDFIEMGSPGEAQRSF